MREIKVEEHLRVGIESLDGLCLKLTVPNRNGPPDRLILLPFVHPHEVECKKPGKDAEDHQKREHARHRILNMPVFVLDTREKVDDYLRVLRLLREAAAEMKVIASAFELCWYMENIYVA